MTSNIVQLYDDFTNFIAGFGTWKDKSLYHEPSLELLNQKQLHDLYRGDWISRKVVDLPAFDSTRAWRQWQAEKDEITLLEKAERQFAIQRKVQCALSRARLYGGSALILGVNQGTFDQELNVDAIKKGDLKFVHTVERWMIATGERVQDILSPWYGEPTYYVRSNTPVNPSPDTRMTPPPPSELKREISSGQIYIHPSRVIRFVGLEYPDIDQAPDVWGDSALQPVYRAVRNADMVSSALSAMIAEAKLDIIKVGGLSDSLSTTTGTNKLIGRFQNACIAKGILNTLLIDKDNEEWDTRQLNVAGMENVLMAFLQVVSGASDIPSTRLLGRSPAGQNATGESDMRNYYDRISSEQNMALGPALNKLDEVMIRSTFGVRPEAIHAVWRPLWQESPDVKAKVALAKAQAHKIDVDNGLINPDALRLGRENDLIEDAFLYPGFEQALDDADPKTEQDLTGEEIDETDPLLPQQPPPPQPPKPPPPPPAG